MSAGRERSRAREGAHARRRGYRPQATATPFEDVVAAMRDPAFYGARGPVEFHETHISCVFAVGERAYKLKKPVVLPFLDYGTVQRRRALCEREVVLNRRFAGDLYLGVRGVIRRDGRLALGADGDDAVEPLVEMRRYGERDTLAAAVCDGRADTRAVAAVGRAIARLHADAEGVPVDDGVLAAHRRMAAANFEALLGDGPGIAPARVLTAQRFTDAFLAGHAGELAARAASGFVRECHGDIRAEHVLLGEPVRIVDCAEFDDRLRQIDVGDDLAFLVMDLAALGREDLGSALVDSYRAAGGDPGPDWLLAFHAAARAWVRAKVALLRSRQPGSAPQALGDVRARFALGERFAWRARRPIAIAVCGAPASGKSTLARALAQASGLRVISSDETRKRLAGLAPTQRAPQSAYTATAGTRTYAELGRAAGAELRRSGGVIVDATFGGLRERRAFAAAFPAAPIFFECRCPASVADERARRRERDRARVSDADAAVAARLRRRFSPLEGDVPARRHHVLRTDQPTEDALGDLVAMLDRELTR